MLSVSVRGSEKIEMELLMYFLATVKCAPKISMNCLFVVTYCKIISAFPGINALIYFETKQDISLLGEVDYKLFGTMIISLSTG